jgi:hypothetical protein
MKSRASILFLVGLLGCAGSTGIPTARRVAVGGDFVHDSTTVTFPVKIRQFTRTEITSFNESNTNIGATYESTLGGVNSTVAVCVYPAGKAYQDRLLNEYTESLSSIATLAGKEVLATQHPLRYSKDGYRVIGLTAHITGTLNPTLLTLFECGKWFLKMRVTSVTMGVGILDSLQSEFLESFRPTDIVRRDPLRQEGKVLMAPAAFQDSVLLHASLLGAFKTMSWARNNVDTLERCAGFPGLYLAGHTEPILEMIKDWEKSRKERSRSTDEYFTSLKEIRDAGFINEFVMAQYKMILVASDTLHLDFQRYEEWKQTHRPGTTLDTKYFMVGYEN